MIKAKDKFFAIIGFMKKYGANFNTACEQLEIFDWQDKQLATASEITLEEPAPAKQKVSPQEVSQPEPIKTQGGISTDEILNIFGGAIY